MTHQHNYAMFVDTDDATLLCACGHRLTAKYKGAVVEKGEIDCE